MGLWWVHSPPVGSNGPETSVDFMERCLSTSEGVSNSVPYHEGPMLDITLNSTVRTSLVREWAKSKLTFSSWKGALAAAASVSISFYSGVPCSLDSVWSFRYRSSRFIGLFVTVSKRLTAYPMQLTVTTKSAN